MTDDLRLRAACLTFAPPQVPAAPVMDTRIASTQNQASSSSSVTFGRQPPLPIKSLSNRQTPANTSGRTKAPVVLTPESLSTTPRSQQAPAHVQNPSLAYLLGLQTSPSIRTAPLTPHSSGVRDGLQRPADQQLAEENRGLRVEMEQLQEENQRLRSAVKESERTADAEAKNAKASRLEAEKWNKLYVKAKKVFNRLHQDFVKLNDEEGDELDAMYVKAKKLFKRLRRDIEDMEDEE